jgi:probable F420-dependent oxidoreductase
MVISNDWRNPVLLAREAATLDWLSGGRFEFGVGAGWLGQDYKRLGMQFEPPATRIERLAEAIAIMRDLLSGQTVSRDGQYYRIADASIYPAPVQKPHPPIVVGGGSRRILTLAGRLANIVSIYVNVGAAQQGEVRPDWGMRATQQRVDWVKTGAGDRFDDIELGVRVGMAALTDRPNDTAARLGAPWQLDEREVLSSPYALIGNTDSICEALLERRERYGFSYFVWDDSELEAMSPVVSTMSGR